MPHGRAPVATTLLAALLAVRGVSAARPSGRLRSASGSAALQATPVAKLVGRPPVELDLASFALTSRGEASAEQRGLWSPLLNATLPDGKEVACLNCDQSLFQAWVDELSFGAHSSAAEAAEPLAHTKHPNAPGYDSWAKSNLQKQESRAGLLQASATGNPSNLAAANVSAEEQRVLVSVRNLGPADLQAMRPRLQQLWAERRLVLGYGVDPVHQRMDFIEALVSLARNSPALVPEDCGSLGHSAPYCGALLSGMLPVAKENELRSALGKTFGTGFLWKNRYQAGLSPKELRGRVTALLQALKADFHFYRQGCLAQDAKESCSAATTAMMGRIACAPEADKLSDDCVYAELRRCGSDCASKRFFEYTRFHGPLALFGTRESRKAVMGQCEEFSRAGYAMLASAGYEARYVLDFTDHVWVEVKLPSENDPAPKWVHADPSEGVLDQPLMYEKGWGKQLTMIFAFTPWAVEHITSTYTEDYQGTVQRRGFPDEDMTKLLAEVNSRLGYEMPLKKWGYTSGFHGSAGRSLDEVALWSHFESR